MYWFNYKIVVGSQKKNKSLLTLLEPQSNELLVYKLQSVHSKQKIMHEGNKLCMLQTRIKSH